MDKKVLLRLLNHRLEEIGTSLNSFKQSGIIHEIEVDLLLSKIRFFYSEVKLLSELKEEIEKPGETIPEQTDAQEEKTEALPPEPVLADDSVDPEPGVVPEPQLIQEPEATPKPTAVPEPQLIQEPDVTPPPPPVPEPEATPEQSANTEVRIESPPLTRKTNGKLLTGVKMQAVKDIMAAIGLNDRFLFTRELFNNDAELFTKTIGILNQKGSWENAAEYLTDNFDWNPEDPTLILFLSVVKRRFI